MGNDISTLQAYQAAFYNPYQIERYLSTLPLWRRILARFFEKHRVTKEEYDAWRINNF